MEPRDLYGLPLERFTAERNALAKELRREGRREEASEVSKLRKPSVAAWAVNQLVRTQREEIDALLTAGDGLKRAQAELLAGRSEPPALREAVDSERVAVEGLVQAARGLLSADGHELTPARLDQVSDTLHAAALDDEARLAIGDGCLVRELRHVGLGGLSADVPPAGRRPATRAKSPPRATTRREPSAPSPSPKEVAKERTAALRAARQAESEARRRLERAGRGVAVAEDRRRRAEADLQAAREALTAARAAREEAAQRHDLAQQTLEDLTKA